VHEAAFTVSEKLPAAHALHVWSAIAEPEVTRYSPATQSFQEAHAMALLVSLKLPAAHALHVRSAVAEPAVATYSPAKQSFQALHAVAARALL